MTVLSSKTTASTPSGLTRGRALTMQPAAVPTRKTTAMAEGGRTGRLHLRAARGPDQERGSWAVAVASTPAGTGLAAAGGAALGGSRRDQRLGAVLVGLEVEVVVVVAVVVGGQDVAKRRVQGQAAGDGAQEPTRRRGRCPHARGKRAARAGRTPAARIAREVPLHVEPAPRGVDGVHVDGQAMGVLGEPSRVVPATVVVGARERQPVDAQAPQERCGL